MEFSKTIGVLGGVGPAASAYALERLVSLCQTEYKAVQDADFPRIVLTSYPVSDMTEKGVSSGEHTVQLTQSLKDGYKTLASAGAQLVYTACNTLSLETNVFDSLSMKHIGIIERTVEYITATHPTKSVAVLGSASTRSERLYESRLIDRGVNVRPISDDDQLAVDQLILSAMAGVNISEATVRLNELCVRLLSSADCVVLGCTELSLIADQRKIGDQVLDAQEITLRELLKEARV